ncbi:hypothetical protein LTR28_004595 [Elasticomyces elasticus]|nr:hypothetical protein LTR28_004595 [Elasticomyces elasticus]
MAGTDTSSNSRHNDEEHDQIGSGTSTPPGAATPRPDLIDKRLPGILNTYFGQVRNPFRIPSWSSSALASATTFPDPASQDGSHESGHEAERKEDDSGLPTAPSSPSSVAAESHASPPLLPHEKPARSHKRKSISPQQFYPTPPLSSASSMHKPEEPASGSERAEENTDLPRARSNTHVRGSNTPSRLRRHTLAFNTLSNIVTKPAVAVHISNPASQSLSSFTAPSSPAVARRSSSRRSRSTENQRLTEGARRRSQNTPPQTPRALSHETKESVPASARNGVADSSSKKSRSSSGGSSAPTIGSIKGQLSIQVVEARGLRPSTNPYVVCIFQANEDISDGPKNDEADTRPANGQPGDEDLARGVAMRRLGSDAGRSIAIPMRSRQSSSTNIAEMGRSKEKETTNPVWNHKALFDVVGANNEVDISVYDKSNQEAFIGHVRFNPVLSEYEKPQERWFKLEPREGEAELVTGEAHLRIQFHKIEKRVYGPEDFQILKLIGKGTFGQVFQVRKKDTQRIYAMKVLSKKVIVQKKEIAHTIGERNILVRTAMTESPFIVGLKFSFQTPQDLYLVTDYMSGGELFWHLQKEGRFVESRAKFYIAELILALRHLHDHDIVYRDLKPENILLDANGHIALCDFGLSKANLTKNSTTNTFCGTTEYLAPEVLLDEHGYNKMVDFWSLGVLVFEMCCGWSPFYAEDTQQMYKNIAFGKVKFPRDALSLEGRNFVKGLLNRNPHHRLGAQNDAAELMRHPFFADVDWDALGRKALVPPFKPKLKDETDTSNFDPEFTNALAAGASLNARAAAFASGLDSASTPLSPTMQTQFQGFTFVDESTLDREFGGASAAAGLRFLDEEDDGVGDGERMDGVVNGGGDGNEPEGLFDDGILDDL